MSQNESIYPKRGLSQQTFQILNEGSSFTELFTLGVPYLILRETCNPGQNLWTLSLSGPDICVQDCNPYENYRQMHDLKAPHQHSYYEFAYIIQGTTTQNIEKKPYAISEGECLLMNQNVRHQEELEESYDVVFLMIAESYLKELFSLVCHYMPKDSDFSSIESLHHMVFNGQKAHYYYKKEFFIFKPVTDSKMADVLSQLLQELSLQTPGYKQVAHGLLCRMLYLLADTRRFHLEHHVADGKNDDLLFRKISQLLKENHGNISRSFISDKLSYNEDYLNSIVKRHTGMSLKKYAQIFCLEEAARLLSNSNMSVTDIIHELGLSNRTYFYRAFTRHYGLTPKEYQMLHKKEEGKE